MVSSRCQLLVLLMSLPLCSVAVGAAAVEQVNFRSGAAEGSLPTTPGKPDVANLTPVSGLDYLSNSKISWTEEVEVVARVYRSAKGNGTQTAQSTRPSAGYAANTASSRVRFFSRLPNIFQLPATIFFRMCVLKFCGV